MVLTRTAAVIAALVLAVLGVSLVIGVTSPDGTIRTSAESTTAPAPAEPSAAPRPDVSGVWPGRPDEVRVDGTEVDWCPAVRADASAAAIAAFGRDEVDAAACAAVSFVLDHRYSDLSIPRDYRASDFDDVLPAISRTTADTYYRRRIAEFVAAPGPAAADRLGLVLLTSAGPGHTFRHDGAATWIDPHWSTVSVTLDTTRSTPRLTARLTARASVPVVDEQSGDDDMLTVPTTAGYLLRHEDGHWTVAGWTVRTGDGDITPLSVH